MSLNDNTLHPFWEKFNEKVGCHYGYAHDAISENIPLLKNWIETIEPKSNKALKLWNVIQNFPTCSIEISEREFTRVTLTEITSKALCREIIESIIKLIDNAPRNTKFKCKDHDIAIICNDLKNILRESIE